MDQMGNMVANKEDVRKGCKWGKLREKNWKFGIEYVMFVMPIRQLTNLQPIFIEYFVPDTVLSASYILTHLILTTAPKTGCFDLMHPQLLTAFKTLSLDKITKNVSVDTEKKTKD